MMRLSQFWNFKSFSQFGSNKESSITYGIYYSHIIRYTCPCSCYGSFVKKTPRSFPKIHIPDIKIVSGNFEHNTARLRIISTFVSYQYIYYTCFICIYTSMSLLVERETLPRLYMFEHYFYSNRFHI